MYGEEVRAFIRSTMRERGTAIAAAVVMEMQTS